MALTFDAGAYGQAYQQGQAQEEARRQRLLQLLQSVTQAGGQIGQGLEAYKTKQEEDKPLSQLLGIDKLNSSNSLSQPVSNTPLPQIPSPSWNQETDQTMGPQLPQGPSFGQPQIGPPMAAAGSPDYTSDMPSRNTPPSGPQPGNFVSHFQDWKQGNQQQPQQPQSPTPYGIDPRLMGMNMKQIGALAKAKSLFSPADDSLDKMLASKVSSGQMTLQDAYKLKQQPESQQFAGLDEQGNPVVMGTKTGQFTTRMTPGGKLMPKPAASSMTNTDYTAATPQDQQMAVGVQEGRIRPSDISFRDRGRIVGLAQDYATRNNLPFQSYAGDVKKGMAENLAYGKMGQNSLSLNTALGHVGDAFEAYKNVQNTNQAWLNVPLNELKRRTNDPNITALDINLNAVNGELATVFKGSSGTDQEIGHWMNVLNDRLTPVQAQAALSKVGTLLNSRLNAMKYSQSDVMNNSIDQRQLLSPHGADVMQKISNPTQSGPRPGTAENGYIFQGGDPADPKSWVKQ